MKVLTGGCHCGLIRFECTSDLDQIIACNCSICTKHGLHLIFVPEESFVLRAGEDDLHEYLFNKRVIHHQLCRNCGTHVFARAVNPNGMSMVAVNINTADNIDVGALTLTPFDGRSL